MHFYRLRSQQRGKPCPTFSLDKIHKKRKQRVVNTAVVQQVAAQLGPAAVLAQTTAPVPAQVPPPTQTPVAAPQPASMQLPARQLRVVLHDIMKKNTTCTQDVSRRVQKRKNSSDDSPSTKRRRVQEEKKRKEKKRPADRRSLRRSARIAVRNQPESTCPSPEPEVQPSEVEFVEEREEQRMVAEQMIEEDVMEQVVEEEERVQDNEEQVEVDEDFGEPEEEIVDVEEWWWMSEEEADVEIKNISEYLSEESIPCDALGCDYVSWTLEGYRNHILVVHGIEMNTGQGQSNLRAQPIEYEEEEETQQQLTEEEEEEREFRRWQKGFRRVQRRIRKELREERRARGEEN